MKHAWILAVALAAAVVPSPAAATDAPAKQAAALSAGEIVKVDREAKKLTIKHGPLQNLRMRGMTMVFKVKEAAMLDGLAPGTKIRFHAEESQGGYLVTKLQVAKGN